MSAAAIPYPASPSLPLDHVFAAGDDATALPLVPLTAWGAEAPPPPEVTPFARALGFTAAAGSLCALPSGDGQTVAAVLAGLGDGSEPWALGDLPGRLPPGTYRLDGCPPQDAARHALAWALGAYAFTAYRTRGLKPPAARLCWPAGVEPATILRTAAAVALARDLINTPAEDMGPADLEAAAAAVAAHHGATVATITGDALPAANLPAIHAVGRASPRPPRLIDLRWGPEDAPRVTVVGKGVCFDTGGLDLKPASAMKLMKKDMGGAANALGLAALVMGAGLPLRLRVLIPAVDNAVSGNALRPGDVIATRKGLRVEVNNTDAEGRLILADALALAAEEAPALLIDLATLTGAARVALGPDLPPFFTDDETLAADLARAATAANDPMWRLPLWPGYRKQIDSEVADLDNAPEGGMAGAITAALFLREFVAPGIAWLHVDLYGWTPKPRPGRPAGGAAQAMLALFALLAERYPPTPAPPEGS